LQRSNARKHAGEAGFTLVELLVVIVILGILAAIVVFAVGGITDKGQTASCKADKATLEAAEEAYFASLPTGVYVDSTVANSGGLLVPKFLHEASTLHEVQAGTPTGSYTITGIGSCTGQ
jgi:general secretion pathway protein G